MILYCHEDIVISLPLPLFLVVEDVGWWRGEDGSAEHGPFRNRFPRHHCLADYRALARLSEHLTMRLAIAMVVGEWDKDNVLKDVPGATWMGRAWDNRRNQGPWLAEAAAYLRNHEDKLEIAVHGLCHEFWQDGRLQRSEFHDRQGRMRPREIVAAHLAAYQDILRQHGFSRFPRLFVPPALHHSFGNGESSPQAVLRTFGIDYVTTRFSRARQYAPPLHEKITWECGVTILERGISPVKWHDVAAVPATLPANPVLALHWPNLLHIDPDRNAEVVDRWAEQIRAEAAGLGRIISQDISDCWRQAAVFYLADYTVDDRQVFIGLQRLPQNRCLVGPFSLKFKDPQPSRWRCTGAQILSVRGAENGISTIRLLPDPGRPTIRLHCDQIARC